MTTVAETAGALAPAFSRKRSIQNQAARLINGTVVALCYLSALLAITALFLILGYITLHGVQSLNLAFFSQLPPVGMRNCIAGTLVIIGMASCLGVPLGMLCGIYLSEYAGSSTFAHGIRLVVDVLAGVPSILIGVLGYELVVVPMHHASAWAGAVALGFMMCPIISRTTEEMLRLVPKALREASVGLSASRAQTLFRVVVPAASSGIITGIMLAVARVAGETAPLIFTVLGSDQPVFSFDSAFPFFHADLNNPFPSLTVKIYQYAQSAKEDWLRQVWAGMFILVMLVLVLNIAVRFASRRRK